MAYDCRGVEVTTQNPAARDALDKAVASFLTHRGDLADRLSAALAADRDLVAAHCLSGFSYLLLGRAELFPLASCAYESARTALAERGGTARERALTDALGAWIGEGAMEKSAALLDATLEAEPCDAMIAKLVQSIRFMLGDAAGMRRSIANALTAWSPDQPGYGFMLGCHAFALEETGALAKAEELGREALAHETYDVWACHAVAHVYETRNEPAHGLAWLMLHEARWGEVNNFARHMFWHRALFHLARNEADIALGLYDTKIRGAKSDDYRDVANAASLLRRLVARGVRVGTRWRELADIAERHVNDHALAFAQFHYLLCLIGDGREDAAYRSFAAMDVEARTGRGTQAELLGAIGLDLAKLMLGGAQATDPRRLRSGIARLGGSNAQRQIFAQIVDRAAARERRAA